MPHQLWLADACREWLTTEEYSGWSSRGSSSFTPSCVVCHWTAGPCNSASRPSLGVVVNGREGLSGPLANIYLDRQGVAVVVAAGRANHAGDGGWHGLSGNSSALGIEAECCNAGDWTAAQRTAYPRLVAALLTGIRRDASWCCGHNEWAPSRKIDIHDWPMPGMREQVAALLGGGPTPPPVEVPDVTPEEHNLLVAAASSSQQAAAVAAQALDAARAAHRAAEAAVLAAAGATEQARQATTAAEQARADARDAAGSAVELLYATTDGRTLGDVNGDDLGDVDDSAPFLGRVVLPELDDGPRRRRR